MTLKVFFERIQKQYHNELPFVVYRKPNAIKIEALLQNNIALHKSDDFTESGFVFSPFDDTLDTVLIPLNSSENMSFTETSATLSNSDNYQEGANTSKSVVSSESKNHHINLVKKGVSAIHSGFFKKVVLSRKEDISLSNQDPMLILKKLLDRYKRAFVYCWYHPKVGLWLGATPETLIKIEGRRFSMMALAGTQDYQGSLDVVWQEKEIQEQQFVTDFIIEQITDTIDDIKVTETETVRAGNVLHLKTQIQGRIDPKMSNLEALIRRLHPTPAVCGLPKAKAKAFILENEDYHREFYTGFLGELNMDTRIAPRSGQRNIENKAYGITRKRTQLYVNLRCMQLRDDTGVVYVGGGITQTSNPESEWEETVSKSLVIKNVLE